MAATGVAEIVYSCIGILYVYQRLFTYTRVQGRKCTQSICSENYNISLNGWYLPKALHAH